ncbi:MAG: hypothetical protein C5B49_02170, partial [Bdellovibrio sp.]
SKSVPSAWAAKPPRVLTPQTFAGENFLRFYVFPTRPFPIIWENPRKLINSLGNAVLNNNPHSIGHVSTEIHCSNEHEITGAVSSEQDFSADLMINEAVGFSILEMAWPGRLEKEEEVLKSATKAAKKKDALSIATFVLSEPSCRRMLDFVKAYREDSYPKYYGFSPRPRRHEGSGCTAFAATLLDIAGLLHEEFQQAWLSDVRIPFSLMPTHNGGRRYTVEEALKHPDSAIWAPPLARHMNFIFFDPDRIHAWVLDQISRRPEQQESLSEWPGIPALRLEMTQFPTPDEPLFNGTPDLVKDEFGAWVRSETVSPRDSFELLPW